ncbi:cytochrome P450 3A16 [Ixodes scapularis]
MERVLETRPSKDTPCRSGSVRDCTVFVTSNHLHRLLTGGTPTLMVADPELLKEIMITDFSSFPNTQFIGRSGDPVLDNMLVALMDDEWRATRSVVAPTFSTSKIKHMVPVLNSCAQDTVQSFCDVAAKGVPYDVKQIFTAYVLDVIAQTNFSIRLDSHRDANNPFVVQAKRIFGTEKWRAFFCFQFPRLSTALGLRIFAPEAIHFFADLMTDLLQRRKCCTENEMQDFIRLLMNAEPTDEGDLCAVGNGEAKPAKKRVLSRDQILAQAVLFFLAGVDTSANTLAMSAYHLALNQDVQARLVEEIDQALLTHKDITLDVVMGLPYLDAFVMEVLRISGPVTMTYRTCVKDTRVGTIPVDKGTLVRIPIYSLHHDQRYFPDPEVFDPSRFLGDNRKLIQPFTYLPFGEGPRQCVGMKFALFKVKFCLFHVLSKISFQVCPETDIPPTHQPVILVMIPETVTLKVTRRKPAAVHCALLSE